MKKKSDAGGAAGDALHPITKKERRGGEGREEKGADNSSRTRRDRRIDHLEERIETVGERKMGKRGLSK